MESGDGARPLSEHVRSIARRGKENEDRAVCVGADLLPDSAANRFCSPLSSALRCGPGIRVALPISRPTASETDPQTELIGPPLASPTWIVFRATANGKNRRSAQYKRQERLSPSRRDIWSSL